MSVYKPKAVYAASEQQYTLQQVENFKYLGVWYWWVTEGEAPGDWYMNWWS